jgi:hypothetical protein
LSGQKGEPLTFVLLLSGNACFSLSFDLAVSLKNGPPVPLRRPRSPLEDSCHQEATWRRILNDGRAEDEGDEHWEVDKEEVSDEV